VRVGRIISEHYFPYIGHVVSQGRSQNGFSTVSSLVETSFSLISWYLEELGDDDIALGPLLGVKTCDRFLLKTIIKSSRSSSGSLRVDISMGDDFFYS